MFYIFLFIYIATTYLSGAYLFGYALHSDNYSDRAHDLRGLGFLFSPLTVPAILIFTAITIARDSGK